MRGLAKVMSKHRAGVRTMRLATRLECIGSSPRVSEACQDGTREFTGRRPRLVGRLSGVAERLAGSWEGLEVDLSFGQSQVQASGRGSDDAVGNLHGVRRELAESIESLLGWRKGVSQKNIETL
ncbi:hypothetical protein BHE74_00054341 [Ensete ventricosum]|nr:hypothetical protein BHE74_00054341 [Ensete ventricosum]